MQKEEIVSLFKEKNLRVTPQRIAVYEFLTENPIHPDVETVYSGVIENHPSFSKTTVYNALQSLTKCRLITPVVIDSERIHYDADTSPHGHFLCSCCKKIFDFSVAFSSAPDLKDFTVERRDVYYSGICPHCKNIN